MVPLQHRVAHILEMKVFFRVLNRQTCLLQWSNSHILSCITMNRSSWALTPGTVQHPCEQDEKWKKFKGPIPSLCFNNKWSKWENEFVSIIFFIPLFAFFFLFFNIIQKSLKYTFWRKKLIIHKTKNIVSLLCYNQSLSSCVSQWIP